MFLGANTWNNVHGNVNCVLVVYFLFISFVWGYLCLWGHVEPEITSCARVFSFQFPLYKKINFQLSKILPVWYQYGIHSMIRVVYFFTHLAFWKNLFTFEFNLCRLCCVRFAPKKLLVEWQKGQAYLTFTSSLISDSLVPKQFLNGQATWSNGNHFCSALFLYSQV